MLSNRYYYGICFDCGEYSKLAQYHEKCKCGGMFRITERYGECSCGEEVEFSKFTNTCHKCGRDYNMSGHLLANREQWGEETGESISDILAADSDCLEEDYD